MNTLKHKHVAYLKIGSSTYYGENSSRPFFSKYINSVATHAEMDVILRSPLSKHRHRLL